MMTVFGCIVNGHDISLVIVSLLVCIGGSWATVRLFSRASVKTGTERLAWLLLTAMVSGAAIWCTHFIAILGFDAGTPISFDPSLTVLSLLVAIVGAALGLSVAINERGRAAPAVGGAVVGLAIVVMHYTGMMAYRVQGIVSWDYSYLLASVVLATTLSAIAFHAATRRIGAMETYIATGCLTLAIVSLHFTGMTALRVEPLIVGANFSNPAALRVLGLVVAAVAFIVVAVGIACHFIDDRARMAAADALGNMTNGLVMVDRDGTIRLYNARLLEIFNLKPAAMRIGMPLPEYLKQVGASVGWDEARTQRIIDNHGLWMKANAVTKVEHHFDGGMVLSIAFRPIPNGGAVLTYDDVTEARESQQKIAHMAFHDELTALPNRRAFVRQIERLVGETPFAMLMIDLDRFKSINDTMGHAAGDMVLIEVGRRLQELRRPEEQMFRLGGDEFAVLANATPAEADELAGRILVALSQAVRVGAQSTPIGASIGWTMSQPQDDAEIVQRKADLALYEAKAIGRGRVLAYRDGMMESAAQVRRFEEELAAAAKGNQFELYYQPLFSLPGRTLTGFEALLRWNHPVRGLVPAGEFIPVAERSGIIVEIGQWVIDEACRQLAQWPAGISVAINISPVQLQTADLLLHVMRALDRHGLTPGRVEIEITETALLESSEQIALTLAGLRALGVRIAMDDFGTGYSSLAHLRTYELDRIKIDQTFIKTADRDVGSAAVVRAVMSMAQDLAIETTGEGVETEAQLAALVALGCRVAQGNLLGTPLDQRRATALVDAMSGSGGQEIAAVA